MARLIDGLQAACRRGRRRGEWRLLCVVMVVLALGFVSVADAAEAAPKPEAKPAPPTPEVTVATSGKLVLDGQDADWLEVPVLIDGRKAKRPGRGLKRFLKVKTMKVAQKGNDLWILLTVNKDLAKFVAKHPYYDVGHIYFDTDANVETGSTTYEEKVTQGNERRVYVSLNTLPKEERHGRVKDVTFFALMSVSRYDPALTAKWKQKDEELKKRKKALTYGREFATPQLKSLSHKNNALVALAGKTIEMRVPLRELSEGTPDRVQITLMEHVGKTSAKLGTVILRFK